MDGSKNLSEEIYIKPNTKGQATPPPLIKISVHYQWKPKRCEGCQAFEHSDKTCPHQIFLPANQNSLAGPAQTIASSSSLSRTILASASTMQVWRIATKKGKSRLSLEQSGILPLPTVQGGSSNPISTDSLSSAELESPQTATGIPEASPPELTTDNSLKSLSPVKKTSSISSSLRTHSNSEPLASSPFKAHPALSYSKGKTTTAGNSLLESSLPLESPPLNSPSPKCSSKLVDRVKFIDGTIQIQRQTPLLIASSAKPDQYPTEQTNQQNHLFAISKTSILAPSRTETFLITGVSGEREPFQQREASYATTSLPSASVETKSNTPSASKISEGLMQGRSSVTP